MRRVPRTLGIALVVALTAISSAAAVSVGQAAEPTGLDDPVKKETALRIVSSAENSSLDWRGQYDYIEDIGDGRGYTGGIVGFCSGTHDMLELVEHYTEQDPDNPLAEYLPALREVDGTDSHEGLDPGYTDAWRQAAQTPEFQAAQEHERDRVYFEPSVALAKSDGIGTLGQFAYFDAIVMHGAEGLDSIRADATGNADTPTDGGDETDYLNAFLDARVAEMETEPAHEDTSRVDTAQRVFLENGNLNLDTPLVWHVYGEEFRIEEDPTERPVDLAGEFTVVGAGDIAAQCTEDQADCQHFKTAARAEAIAPAFYLTMGDNQYDDAHIEDFRAYYDNSWGRFKDNTNPVPGNHEAYDDWENQDERAYREYFGSRATPQGKMWYGYDHGNWHFIALNSNRFDEQEQLDWLAEDLSANTKQCVAVYFHHPLFSSGSHGNDPVSRPVWDQLYEAGVEVVLNGHDHHYERFAPQDPDGQASDTGIVEIIGGMGGKDLYGEGDTVQDNSEVRIWDQFGVLRLDFTDNSFTSTLVGTDGTELDTSPTYTCH